MTLHEGFDRTVSDWLDTQAGHSQPAYLDEIVLDGFRWNSTAYDPDGIGTILPAITLVRSPPIALDAGLTIRTRSEGYS